jgi:hypothetical protein
VAKKPMKFVQTGGGAFILLPLELRKEWDGAGDNPDDPKSDYAKTRPFTGKLGVLKVGSGTALIIGTPEETAFWPLPDGGVLVQKHEGEEDEDVHAGIEEALAEPEWLPSDVTFEVGDKGRLALFDSYDTYADLEKEDRIEIPLAPGTYAIDLRDVKDEEAELHLHLIRLKKV